MWVTCHKCDGEGFIKKDKKVPCNICNPHKYILDTIMLGQIWVNDNYFPITPPNSP